MDLQKWAEMVSVAGITATAIGIPLGSFFKWLLKKLIANDQTIYIGNNNPNGTVWCMQVKAEKNYRDPVTEVAPPI
ncbi:hypothetical protein M758_2G063200 [Ceratodon purpureus]|nr:hypothetical protein M758_2G063200 [Ceratodon purpureus]